MTEEEQWERVIEWHERQNLRWDALSTDEQRAEIQRQYDACLAELDEARSLKTLPAGDNHAAKEYRAIYWMGRLAERLHEYGVAIYHPDLDEG